MKDDIVIVSAARTPVAAQGNAGFASIASDAGIASSRISISRAAPSAC